MNFWIGFWTTVLLVAVVSLTGLAVVVTIGGFLDLRGMFQSMRAEQEDADAQPDAR